MKKVLVSSAVVLGAFIAMTAPAFAQTGNANPRLVFANDYARSIAHFQINDQGRVFLVQQNPVTILEIKSKIYWLEEQKDAVLAKDLQVTF